jgi:hypothetical protein
MRLFLIAILFLAIGLSAHSQTKAITTSGDTVLLNEDGTWVYQDKYSSSANIDKILLNDTKYTKPAASTKFLSGGKGIYEIWYDPSIWVKANPSKYNDDAELALEMNGKMAYGIMIYEKVEIPVESLLEIALENAQSSAPNFKIISREYRIVNGNKVALMHMEGNIEGINATYYSYYYSNSSGTWQFHAYTMTSLFKQLKKQMEALLNGLVIK